MTLRVGLVSTSNTASLARGHQLFTALSSSTSNANVEAPRAPLAVSVLTRRRKAGVFRRIRQRGG